MEEVPTRYLYDRTLDLGPDLEYVMQQGWAENVLRRHQYDKVIMRVGAEDVDHFRHFVDWHDGVQLDELQIGIFANASTTQVFCDILKGKRFTKLTLFGECIDANTVLDFAAMATENFSFGARLKDNQCELRDVRFDFSSLELFVENDAPDMKLHKALFHSCPFLRELKVSVCGSKKEGYFTDICELVPRHIRGLHVVCSTTFSDRDEVAVAGLVARSTALSTCIVRMHNARPCVAHNMLRHAVESRHTLIELKVTIDIEIKALPEDTYAPITANTQLEVLAWEFSAPPPVASALFDWASAQPMLRDFSGTPPDVAEDDGEPRDGAFPSLSVLHIRSPTYRTSRARQITEVFSKPRLEQLLFDTSPVGESRVREISPAITKLVLGDRRCISAKKALKIVNAIQHPEAIVEVKCALSVTFISHLREVFNAMKRFTNLVSLEINPNTIIAREELPKLVAQVFPATVATDFTRYRHTYVFSRTGAASSSAD